MKKFLSSLTKIEKKRGDLFDLGDASVLERDSRGGFVKNTYTYYHFDSDCRKAPKTGLDVAVDSNEKGGKVKERGGSQSDDSETVKDSKTAVQPPQDFNETCSKTEQKMYSSMEKNNSKKNLNIINISNSKYFHIGSQKTINISGQQLLRIPTDNNSESFVNDKTDLEKLLDCEQKLTEAFIILISVHINNKWKNFLRNLGLEKSVLEFMESRNDHNRILTVYDALQKYTTLFPNTNLNYVINILIEIQQVALVEKLAIKLKTN